MKIIRTVIALLAFTFATATLATPMVNINTADAQTLSKHIKGIGLKKAEAIVLFRKKHGKFKRVDDLIRVKGIGKKLLEKNKAMLTVGKQHNKK